ncbi:MAG: serine/threonine protein kinase [Actinobacteria bacterium]|jgi:serine/threonine-protein kinase|nr:MAG: serine/threonine protein kinase [Actinomycetota bacterium]
MEGKILKQRYLLKGKLGGGRLADTYQAEDTQMGAPVAVKILYPEIASNAAYIGKLEAELKVAATLRHPNITRPLDWGSEGELYFVVSELITGQSLREILDGGEKLPPQRAARIASDISQALEVVHGHSLVHGGIATNNIFVSDIGEVKLMDVGMAWVATGRGTPQFISPEQAQGLAVDARSDLYSLAVVLYEMLAGRVPFDAPDTQTVVYKLINEVPAPPSSTNPTVPATLDTVVVKALSKDPALRYQSAREMTADLLHYLEGPGVPVVAAPVEKKSSHAGIWAALGIIAILAIAGVILAIVFAGGGTETVQVPNVVGMKQDDAKKALEDGGLELGNIEDQYITSQSQEVGVVVAQDPAAGTSQDKGSKVGVTVTAELAMPNVIGLSQDDAVSNLKKAGVKVVEVNKTPVDQAQAVGKVVTQAPSAGTLIDPDTSVTLEVGEEATQAAVPNVVGLSQNAAEEQLEGAGFAVKVEEASSTEVPQGNVIQQNPAANTEVAKGTTVTITVSTGPPAS